MNRPILVTFGLLSLLFFQSTTAQNQTAQARASSPEAALRVAHLVPEAQDVTVLVDGAIAFQGVVSGSVTGYTLLAAGEHQVVLMPTDAATDAAATGGAASGAALAAVTVTTEAGSYYTVIVTEAADEAVTGATAENAENALDATGGAPVPGVIAQATEPTDPSAATTDEALELITFADTLGDFPPAGEALVRVVHVSPDTPAATLVAAPEDSQGVASQAGGEDAALQAIQGSALVTNLLFASSSPYTAFAADTYHFQLQTANGVAVLDLPDTLIEAGTVYTFYVSGRSASTLRMDVSVDALVSQVLE